ncbi:MAG: hypothetical protein GKR89_02960 [Candidatus Latescibacteria bacterium]|nr:hypothetical protein [Candidatus Latescibacterota bacterium]
MSDLSLKGNFLIATLVQEDELEVDFFTRTVILLFKHNEEGARGLVINRPLGGRVKDYSTKALRKLRRNLALVWGEEVEPEDVVFLGGPVRRDLLLFLHRLEVLAERSVRIYPGVYVGSLEDLRHYAGLVDAEEPTMRFFLGYAEWQPGQLEDEIAQGLWWVGPAQTDLVFSARPQDAWQRALYQLGGAYRTMSFIPENPLVN